MQSHRLVSVVAFMSQATFFFLSFFPLIYLLQRSAYFVAGRGGEMMYACQMRMWTDLMLPWSIAYVAMPDGDGRFQPCFIGVIPGFFFSFSALVYAEACVASLFLCFLYPPFAFDLFLVF